MLERLSDVSDGMVGVKASGKVSKKDYELVFEPLVTQARHEGRRFRLLFELGSEFTGFTPGAAWEDAKLGLKAPRFLSGCAIVTDLDRIRDATKVVAFAVPCPVRVFRTRDRDEAVEWLRSLPHEAGIAHRLDPEKGVIVVEVKGALRVEDFDALAQTADAWIESHGSLQGVVVHARAFPGWENLGSLVRHVQFLRDHHRKVRRIALAADGILPSVAPRLGEHFVEAEVKAFGFAEVDAAIAWAGGAP